MKNIFPVFALAVMFFFCGSVLLRFSVKNVLIDMGVENKFTDIVMFDVREMFKKEKEEESDVIFVNAVREKLQIKAEHKIFNAKNYVKESKFYAKIKKKIEEYTTLWLSFRQPVVQAAFFADYHLGNKILPNNVVYLGDGYLYEKISKDSLQSTDAFVQKMNYFKRILDSLGIPLVYVQYPNVINGREKDKLVQQLRDANIPVIALHKEFPRSFFYKTDHHWQIKASILAGFMISEKLNELYDFGLETEFLDTANFTEIYVKKWLGSIGEKVIPFYPKEDFYVYSPKYPTDINWLLFHKGLFENDGNFDSLYHFLPESDENKELYAYAYPSFSFSRNNDLPDGKKILLIGDSFNNPLSKFLAPVFKEVYFIYRRSSLLDDYLANKPDIVVVGFSGSPFGESLEDLLF
ncbi:MAG: hypothetical protein LBQ87_08200 [Candidatus Fibromonas sp.]|jgi:hypothetical protein|nr:hypothetical protein [Candidatus Fibromonas sp.]